MKYYNFLAFFGFEPTLLFIGKQHQILPTRLLNLKNKFKPIRLFEPTCLLESTIALSPLPPVLPSKVSKHLEKYKFNDDDAQ
jgi:hypothetical protein